MYCSECGKHNSDDAMRCVGCGAVFATSNQINTQSSSQLSSAGRTETLQKFTSRTTTDQIRELMRKFGMIKI